MTYCLQMSSSTALKSLIPRDSLPLNWRIGNSFAYKYADLVACGITRPAPSPLPDPASTQPAATSLPRPGLWNGLRFFGAAAISDGSPRRGVWAESPCRGGGEGAWLRVKFFMDKKDGLDD